MVVGTNQNVVIPLIRGDISYWSKDEQQWIIPSGAIGISLRWSSRDIVLKQIWRFYNNRNLMSDVVAITTPSYLRRLQTPIVHASRVDKFPASW